MLKREASKVAGDSVILPSLPPALLATKDFVGERWLYSNDSQNEVCVRNVIDAKHRNLVSIRRRRESPMKLQTCAVAMPVFVSWLVLALLFVARTSFENTRIRDGREGH